LGPPVRGCESRQSNASLACRGQASRLPFQIHATTPKVPLDLEQVDRDRRKMVRNLRLHPKMTFEHRREATGLECKNTWIKDLARANGIHYWRAKKCPDLTDEIALLRYDWARVRAYWNVERWKQYIWSDECSAERGKGQKQVWVFGIPSEKWMPKNVSTYKKGKQIRVMVWACFWGNGERTPLYIMDRDFESKKQGYSASSYIAVLEDNLPFHYQDVLLFMQDNAPIHTAHRVREWFQENGIHITDWPPFSPDLNPIEHAWKAFKEKMCEMYPDLWNGKGTSEADLQVLEEGLCKAWDALPNSLFESLVESMPDRIAACIDANGWHTKY
jgi:hypothetical protein